MVIIWDFVIQFFQKNFFLDFFTNFLGKNQKKIKKLLAMPSIYFGKFKTIKIVYNASFRNCSRISLEKIKKRKSKFVCDYKIEKIKNCFSNSNCLWIVGFSYQFTLGKKIKKSKIVRCKSFRYFSLILFEK